MTKSRLELSELQGQNDHDVFVDLEGALGSTWKYYISRIQRCKISTKRRWLLTQFPESEEIVVIDNPNSVHAFNRLEEEGHVERYGCHFKLIDLTRKDLYDIGMPAIDA